MQTVIFSGGKVVKSDLILKYVKNAKFVVAADSGADSALNLGIIPKVVIGDMDSLSHKSKMILEKKKVAFITSPSEKDETDTELAIDYAIKNGATDITIIGGIFGERIDHILANIMYAGISKIPIKFVNGRQESFVIKGPTKIVLEGGLNDLLSLVPLQTDVTGLESSGLKWELHDGILVFGKPRGVSNVFTQKKISLSFASGTLFITHIHLS